MSASKHHRFSNSPEALYLLEKFCPRATVYTIDDVPCIINLSDFYYAHFAATVIEDGEIINVEVKMPVMGDLEKIFVYDTLTKSKNRGN